MQFLEQQLGPSFATQGGLQPSSRDLLHAEILYLNLKSIGGIFLTFEIYLLVAYLEIENSSYASSSLTDWKSV